MNLAAALLLALPALLGAQAPDTGSADVKDSPLFASTSPLAVRLIMNIGQLRRERGKDHPWHPSILEYSTSADSIRRVPLRAHTHGIWRLAHCEFPPLRLSFSGKESVTGLFHHLGKPKLVNHCRDTDRYEQLVVQEYQLYRIYQLLTPASHRARLLHITYVDSASRETYATRYGFLIEDPNRMAARLHGRLVKQKGASADDFDHPAAAIVYLFEYLIGNTDFSFNGVHNGELVALEDGNHAPIAYDFDFAGAVNAPYATPDPVFRTRSVRDRVFRGYCALADGFPAAAALFREKKPAIYALYHDEIGRLIDERTVAETLRYYDDFYDLIATPSKAEESVFNNCVGKR